MDLSMARPSQKFVVKKLLLDNPLKTRIMDMGVTIGSTIEINRTAPFGDPIEIIVRGYHLAIRKSDAKKIIVDIC